MEVLDIACFVRWQFKSRARIQIVRKSVGVKAVNSLLILIYQSLFNGGCLLWKGGYVEEKPRKICEVQRKRRVYFRCTSHPGALSPGTSLNILIFVACSTLSELLLLPALPFFEMRLSRENLRKPAKRNEKLEVYFRCT
jgi:hypothetical protein